MFALVFERGIKMPRDKSENHEKIINAAYKEFMEYGFNDASMRRIAAECDMSASGLYKHFPSKEEMFAALVEPAYSGLKEMYYQKLEYQYEELKNQSAEEIWEGEEETVWVVKYIYDNFNAFKLLICRSQGTRYEDFTHELATLEEKSTIDYLKKIKDKGIEINKISKKEIHLFVTSNINAIFETVIHDFTRKEALAYAKHFDDYCIGGWKRLLGLPE